MSDGDSTFHRRITKPYFRTCSTCRSRSQLTLYFCALLVIAKHDEVSFGLLRYSLGGYRPSKTARLTWSEFQIHGTSLDSRSAKAGISRMAPLSLTTEFQRLPAILHITNQKTISEYSKGSRGLSVLSRVNSIFTATTISPSLLLRQCPDRYTIRAGRNLPDKEFRYLRTVIVTAAIHQGLRSMLRSEELTNPFDLLALGRHHTIYFALTALHSAVFLLNSRLGHFSAAAKCSPREGVHTQRLLFSRSYEDNLPSSLTRVISRALEYSSHSPVSVLVRTPPAVRTYFLETLLATSLTFVHSVRTRLYVDGFTYRPASCTHGLFQSSDCFIHFVSPSPLPSVAREYLTRLPSPTPFGLSLGSG